MGKKKVNVFKVGVLVLMMQNAFAESAQEAPSASLDGVKFVGSFINFTGYNPGSGVEKNAWGNTAQLQLGADFDLAKLAGIAGGQVHIRESLFVLKKNAEEYPGHNPPESFKGHFWAQNTGSTLSGAPFPNFIPDDYLSELTYEQRLGSSFSATVGRLNPMTRFDAPVNCETKYSCQDPIALYDNLTLPPAFATWGAVGKYQFDPENYAQLGIHEDNFDSDMTEGFNWSMTSRSGWFAAAEYGHRHDFGSVAYPWNATAGLWHDSSEFNDPLSGELQHGSNGAYLRTQKVLWREDQGISTMKPSRYIMGFSTTGYSPSSAQPYRGFLEVGANYHGLFHSRPEDFYGMKVAWLRINENELSSEHQARLAAGGDDYRSKPNQYRIELNGHIQVSRDISIEPAVQYIIHPNVQFATVPTALNAPKGGFSLGLVIFMTWPG